MSLETTYLHCKELLHAKFTYLAIKFLPRQNKTLLLLSSEITKLHNDIFYSECGLTTGENAA